MPSRYDNFNLNNGQYIRQYAGSPLDEVTKTSEALQDRHYRNIADLSNLQLLKQQYESKVTPGAKDYIASQFNDIDSTLQDIAANGAENSTAKIAALKNRFLGDQGVLGALRLSEGVQKEIETENQLIAQGKTPIRKKGLRERALNTPVVDPETGKIHELYTRPYQSTVSPYENPVPYMKDIWNEIHPDSVESELRGMDSKVVKDLMKSALGEEGANIPLFFESITRSGITSDKIKANLRNALDSYKETPAYKQAIEYAENPQVEAKRQEKIFLEHGLLNVFNNLSREDKFNPIADDAIRKGKSNQVTENLNPDLSITTPAPKTPLDHINQITESGDIKEGLVDKAIRNITATPEERKEYEKYTTKIGLTGIEPGKVKYDEALTNAAIPYYKAAALYSGNPNAKEMTTDQLKAWAGSKEGKDMLKVYKENVLSAKYKSPIIRNIDPEKARDAQNLFLNSSLTQRKFIPFDDPKKIIHMSDLVTGDANDEALNISKWYTNDPSKIRFTGETTPQNWLGEGTDVEGEFTNAKVIEVPEGDGKSGKIKRYYVSNLPSETNPVEMSEKALSNTGTRIPGVYNKTENGYEVYETINENAKKDLFKELQVPEIMQWPATVVVKHGDDIIIAPNYKAAAFELAKKGKYLTSSK